jgi:hypothetical protein
VVKFEPRTISKTDAVSEHLQLSSKSRTVAAFKCDKELLPDEKCSSSSATKAKATNRMSI